jgi:hypothetical protein
LHAFIEAQVTHAPPPQSTSVSLPFFTPSAQPDAWQMAAVHTPFWQSVPAVQVLPAAHRLQVVVPPQSLSVSPPFFAASEQVAC